MLLFPCLKMPWWVGELWVIKITLISYTVFLVTIILFIFLSQPRATPIGLLQSQ